MRLIPYIANYVEEIRFQNKSRVKRHAKVGKSSNLQKSTFITESVEPSDQDEFCLEKITLRNIRESDPTFETSKIEPSDPDEFTYAEETRITKTIEPSDSDEICYIHGKY